MAQRQKLGIRAYSFSFRKSRTRLPDHIYNLNSEMVFPMPDSSEYVFESALELIKVFVLSSTQTNDREDNQQLFRCELSEDNIGETSDYRYLVFSVFSGYYGIASDVIDRNTKATVYKKTKDQADVKQFYVMVAIPKDTDSVKATRGLIFFQEIGVYGIKTVTTAAMQDFFSSRFNLTIKTQNLAPDFYLEKLLENGKIKRIRLSRNVISGDSADRLYGQNVGHEERSFAPLAVTTTLKWQLRHIAENQYNFFTFDGLDYPDVRMEVEIGGRRRTINLHGIEDLSVEEALPDDLLLADGTVDVHKYIEHMHTVIAEYLNHLPATF